METTKLTIFTSVALYKILNKILIEKITNEDGTVTEKERDIPFNVKYKLQRTSTLLEKDYILYENERYKLIKELGKEQEDKTVKVEDDKLQEFKDSISKFLETEVVHSIVKLTPDEVSNISITGVTMQEMDLFMAALVEDPDLNNELKEGAEALSELIKNSKN